MHYACTTTDAQRLPNLERSLASDDPRSQTAAVTQQGEAMADQMLFRVASRDATPIALWSSGSGPPLVMVHGTSADHLSWELLRPFLENQFTLYAMDRRGRLASGDHDQYDIEREYEDVATVVEHVAEVAGADVWVFGHSFGGTCALMAARITDQLNGLVLYEPPLASDIAVFGPELADQLRSLLAERGGDALLEQFYVEVVGMTRDQVAMLRGLPTWPARAEAAHTVVREFAADIRIDRDVLATIEVPVRLILGSDTSPSLRDDTMEAVAAIPGARLHVLDGEAHIAHYTAPDRLAKAIRELIAGD